MKKRSILPTKRIMLPFGFFLFICYIIFLADTADLNYGLRIARVIPYSDKVMHALLYGMMAMFLNYGLGYKKIYGLQIGAVLVLLFATIEECSQIFIITRTFDFGDLLADVVGVTLFSLAKVNQCKH